MNMAQVAALAMSQLETIPRISNSMTIAQLHTECRARDPGIKGLSNKNKTWLLDHLKIGTPLVSTEVPNKDGTKDTSVVKKSTASTKRLSMVSKAPEKKAAATKNVPKVAQAEVIAVIHADMTIAQLQMECRARDPDIKGLTNKNKSWFLDHLTIGSKCSSVAVTTNRGRRKSEIPPTVKKTTAAAKNAPKVVSEKEASITHADMTLEELQMECRARNLCIGALSLQTKSYLLSQLKIGSPRAPAIHEGMTLAQLRRECHFRDPHSTGFSKKNKAWLLDHLKIGTCWMSSSQWNGNELLPTKKARRSILPDHTRVSSKMTVYMLTQEARARNLCNIPKTKSDLIDLLGEDSVCVKTNDTITPTAESKQKSETAKMNDRTDESKSKPTIRQTKINFGTVYPKNTRRKPEVIDDGPSTKRALKPLQESNKRSSNVDQGTKNSSDTKSGPSKKKRKKSLKPSGPENSMVATSATANSDVTSTEKPSTSKTVAQYTRISNKMTIEQLKEEAKTRRMVTIPKAKCRLLEALVEGSICLYEAPEYKTYQNLLKKMKMEEPNLRDKQRQSLREAEERREINREKRRIAKEKKLAEKRKAEIARQASLHVHSFPRVHKCLLAKTSDLTYLGEPRHAQCSICDKRLREHYGEDYDVFVGYYQTRPGALLYTCESEEWDICAECFQEENMTQAEKKKAEAEEEKLRIRRKKEKEEEYRKEMEQYQREEEEDERRRDETNFSSRIRVVKGKHLDPKSSGMKYTVWCSDRFRRDYEEPEKEFDSVWSTKEDANSRAEYLFYWKNAWGRTVQEMMNEYIQPMERDDLKGYTVTLDGGSTWTVGVVPSESFPYLDNATLSRHYHDEPVESSRWDNEYIMDDMEF